MNFRINIEEIPSLDNSNQETSTQCSRMHRTMQRKKLSDEITRLIKSVCRFHASDIISLSNVTLAKLHFCCYLLLLTIFMLSMNLYQ